jgi:phospholipase/carboxylesterase
MYDLLESKRIGSKSGLDSSLLIFLHGYGANGDDLLGLAEPMSEFLPDTVFVSPNAPEICSGNPGGYQWFPIPWIDGSTEEESELGANRAIADLNYFIDTMMESEGLSEAETVLLGFSQGTMVGLHLALRREHSLGSFVGFSGRLLRPELIKDEKKSSPPILLLHGDQDTVVPFDSLREACEVLRSNDCEVEEFVMEGVGHGISPNGLEECLKFLRTHLIF